MASVIGSIAVEMSANTARFRSDLEKANRAASAAAGGIRASFSNLGSAFTQTITAANNAARALTVIGTTGTQSAATAAAAIAQLGTQLRVTMQAAAAAANATVAGVAVAVTQTAAAALAGLRRASVGAVNALSSFATTAAGLAATLSIVARGNEDLQRKLEGLTVGLVLAGAAGRTLGGALRFMFTPIGLATTAIGGLIAAAVQWESISRFVVATTRETWAALGPFFTQLWRGIMLMAEGLATNLRGVFTLDSVLAQAGTTLFEAGLMRLQTAGKLATDGLGAGFSFVMDKVAGLTRKTVDATDAMNKLTEQLKAWKTFEGVDPFGGFTQARASAMEATARHAQELTESLRDWKTFEGVDPFGPIGPIPDLGADPTITLDGVTRTIKDMAAEQAKFADAFEHTMGAIPALAETATLSLHDVSEAISGGLSRSLTGVIQGTQTLSQAFSRMGQSVVLSINEMIINRGIKALEKAIEELVQSQAFRQFISAFGSALGSYFNTSSTGTTNLGGSGNPGEAMARGGIVKATSGGRLIRAGEAGQDEAVIPLTPAMRRLTFGEMVNALTMASNPAAALAHGGIIKARPGSTGDLGIAAVGDAFHGLTATIAAFGGTVERMWLRVAEVPTAAPGAPPMTLARAQYDAFEASRASGGEGAQTGTAGGHAARAMDQVAGGGTCNCKNEIIVENRAEGVKVERGQSSRGGDGRQIDRLIISAVKGGMARGELDRDLAQFGVSRSGTAR